MESLKEILKRVSSHLEVEHVLRISKQKIFFPLVDCDFYAELCYTRVGHGTFHTCYFCIYSKFIEEQEHSLLCLAEGPPFLPWRSDDLEYCRGFEIELLDFLQNQPSIFEKTLKRFDQCVLDSERFSWTLHEIFSTVTDEDRALDLGAFEQELFKYLDQKRGPWFPCSPPWILIALRLADIDKSLAREILRTRLTTWLRDYQENPKSFY